MTFGSGLMAVNQVSGIGTKENQMAITLNGMKSMLRLLAGGKADGMIGEMILVSME